MSGGLNSNGHLGSIDVNFKRQIDALKAKTRADSSLPGTIMIDETRNQKNNDSIYQSSVNQSMQSGFGLTPKRLQTIDMAGSAMRKMAPF